MSVRKSLRSYVEDLFSKNTDYKFPEQAINQAESLKSLSSDLYTDNIRFIYELIQNADDAEAINIMLTILDNKYLIIAHDGNAFDEKDLQGLCGINNGTKKKDLDKTGYKGLGFKAVFGKSDYVIICSNGEYFRFDSTYQMKWNKQWGTKDQQTWEKENDRQFIYPWQINPIWTNNNEIPYVIQNFLSSKQIHVANIILLNNVEEIRLAIDQLKQQPYMFLFLRNISEMTFSSRTTDIVSIDRNSSYGLKKVYLNQKIISQWIIKRLELNVPDDIREKLAKDSKAPEKLRFIKKAEMFFAAKYKDGDIIEKLQDKETHLFSYLPTKIVDYLFPIIINANFLTNVNREQIHTDSAWNQWLFDNIGKKLFKWIKELVVNDQFYFQAYKLLPSKLNLTNNNLSKQFNEAFDWSIQHCSFIRNRKNQLLKVHEVVMDSTSMSEQSSFIDLDSMRQYVIDYYITTNFQCAEHPFIDYDSNLSRIGVKHFTWHNSIEMFKSDKFLKSQSIEQNKRMIEYFHSKCSDFETVNETGIPIEQIPFLMDQNNCLQSIANIYFSAETIGDSGTTDSSDLFVNKTIFNWLNKNTQKGIKKWLEDLGVDERTDLTYFDKTIIPNASTYITSENAIKTVKMLFMLFQKHHIEKEDLNQLRQLKLLTTRGTLIPAEQCFFSKKYNPRLPIQEYLTKMENKFLSSKYLTKSLYNQESNDINEWYQFFKAMGVHDEIHLICYEKKLNISDAIQHGFCREYLSRPSPTRRREANGYSGLKTITFLKNTQDNFEFAQVFWSFVIDKMNPNDFKQYSTRVYWTSGYGTILCDVDYIEWFVKHIQCIPTTLKKCQLSVNTFIDTNEMKELCGKYMPIVKILSKQDLSKWVSFFNFKTKFLLNDHFLLLNRIRKDEKNLENNQDRLQNIYSHLLNESNSWSLNEQNLIKTKSKTLYLLTENNQWKLANELYLYADGNETDNHLNDGIPSLKLNFKNKTHPNLHEFVEMFGIKQIQINDLKLVSKGSDHAKQFQEKLIQISPFLKKWLKKSSVSSDIILSIDNILQQKIVFIESDRLRLFYNGKSVQEPNVYFDTIHQQSYITRPWHSETTFIGLPKKLCQLLKIQGFEDNLRFLLKAEKKEIIKHFRKLSVEIPTDNDATRLKIKPRSEILAQPLKTLMELSDESMSDQDEQSSSDEEEIKSYIRKPHQQELTDNATCISNTDGVVQLSNKRLRRNLNKRKRKRLSSSNNSVDEIFSHLHLIDLSTISNSSSTSIKTSFNRNGTGGNGEIDRRTGLTGEQVVYEYLLNKYHNQLDSISIKWLNENEDSYLPYDILLVENGIKHYIEVKATRSINQHTFFISINQIKSILQHGENYHIYRVYLRQKKLLILNNIESRLSNRNQLALLLSTNPNSLDHVIFPDE